MQFKTKIISIGSLVLFILLFFMTSQRVQAHCDGMDGPVVKAAQKAIETGNVNLILIWVKKEHENEIKKAFQQTLIVRKLSSESKEMADMYFFETLVRLHRAGEGAPYTGLKPAGRDLGTAIPSADESIEKGSAKDLLKLLVDEVHKGLHKRFQQVVTKKNYNQNDVESGREFVEAYVEFVHYVEQIHEATQKSAHAHDSESEEMDMHKH